MSELTWVEISSNALRNNIARLRSLIGEEEEKTKGEAKK